jgi:hypothetical protein
VRSYSIGDFTLEVYVEDAWVHDYGASILLEIPLQMRGPDGSIDGGSVILGTESPDVMVEEAMRWGRLRAGDTTFSSPQKEPT